MNYKLFFSRSRKGRKANLISMLLRNVKQNGKAFIHFFVVVFQYKKLKCETSINETENQ